MTRIFGVTGSLSKESEKLLKQELGLKVKFRYSLEEAISDKIISSYQINVHYCTLDNKIRNIVGGNAKAPKMVTELERYKELTRKFEWSKYESFSNPAMTNVKLGFAGQRSRFLYNCNTKIELAKKLISKYDRCLIFTTSIESAEKLCENSYHSKSKNDNLEKFINEEIDKLSVINMSNMGITFRGLKNVVAHQLNSSEETCVQRLLRAMNFDSGKIAELNIVVVKDTIDESWLLKALQGFDKNKITYIKSSKL